MGRLLAIGGAVLVVAGCGSGDDGDGGDGYTQDDIASALGLHNKHHEVIYEMAPGKDCVVIQVLTSSDEVESAQSVAGEVPTALAVNPTAMSALSSPALATSPRTSVLHQPSPTSTR